MKEVEEDNEEGKEEDLIYAIEKGDEFLDKLTNSTETFEYFKKYKCFRIFYFWLFYFFIISCFSDLYFYISYLKINEQNIYSIILLYGRLISDLLMLIPNFIFIQNIYEKNKITKITLLGIICFIPQLAINIISLEFIYNFKDNIFCVNSDNKNDKCNKNEEICLIISLYINSILNIITSFLSVIKVIYNY